MTQAWIHTTARVFLSRIALVGALLIPAQKLLEVYAGPDTKLIVLSIVFLSGLLALLVWGLTSDDRTCKVIAIAIGWISALCWFSWGSMDSSLRSFLLIVGPAGVGMGLPLLFFELKKRQLLVMAMGFVAAFALLTTAWLFLEDYYNLWKWVPTSWETGEGLRFKYGHRFGEQRARFLFDLGIEAGVWQWSLGTLLVATALHYRKRIRYVWVLGLCGLITFISIIPTISRAGIIMAGISVMILAASYFLPTYRGYRCMVLVLPALLILGGALLFPLLPQSNIPVLNPIAQTFNVHEAGNVDRLTRYKAGLMGGYPKLRNKGYPVEGILHLPLSGYGLDSFMPNTGFSLENSYLDLLYCLGLTGLLLTLCMLGFHAYALVHCLIFWRENSLSLQINLALALAIPYVLYMQASPGFGAPVKSFLTWTITGFLLHGLRTKRTSATNHEHSLHGK